MNTESKSNTLTIPLFFVADHLALDFLNTAYGVGEKHIDCLCSDAQVLAWLEQVNLPTAALVDAQPGALLEATKVLRDTAQDLVQKRQAGLVGDLGVLNQFLRLGSAYQEIIWSDAIEPHCIWHNRVESIESLLVPVAQSIAMLLEQADFSLVRQCENPECTLWFYDRTKSHRRRWCSMAQCGNRMKVASFRARQKKC